MVFCDNNNNKIICNDISCKKNITFLESNACITIGTNVNLTDSDISLGKGSLLNIADESTIKGKILIGSFCEVVIGKKLTITKNLLIRTAEKTKIQIGDDCLIASNVIIRACDGHPIYDTITGDRINKSEDIYIGNHVWLCDDVVVLKGVSIGDGAIIGMKSLVTKDIPDKCVAAGIPARVIRKNVTWEHTLGMKTEYLYKG